MIPLARSLVQPQGTPASTSTPSRRSQACLSMAHNSWKGQESEWAFVRWETGKVEKTIQPKILYLDTSANANYVQFKRIS